MKIIAKVLQEKSKKDTRYVRAHTQGGLQPNISQSNLKIFSVELQLDEETKTTKKSAVKTNRR